MTRHTRKGLANTKLGQVAFVAAMLLLASRPSSALDSSQPFSEFELFLPSYELAINPLQKSPAFFKFQAHISQAKLPVGDVVFQTVYVNVKKAETLLCQEQFNNVQVRDSVLNVEIGKTMNCALDELIAANSDLLFQVCIGSQENCLKSISLSSVPYAIKSSYSVVSQNANTANTAVQCHYAHRVTADRELFTTQRFGMGYFDFHTPTPELVGNLIDEFDTAMSVPSSYYKGGYIQWMQLDPASKNVHICAQYADSSSETPVRLDELVIHAEVSRALGQLVVEGEPDSSLATKALLVKRGLDVHERADFYGDVNVGNALDAEHVCTVNTKFEVNNTTNINSDAHFYSDVTLEESSTYVAKGPSTFEDTVLFTENVEIGDPVVGSPGNVGNGKRLDIYHETEFHGPVTFGLISATIPNNSIESRHILNGAVTKEDLADGSVISAKIVDGSIQQVDLGIGSVSSEQIVNNTIRTQDLNLIPVTNFIKAKTDEFYTWTSLGNYTRTRFCSLTGVIEAQDIHPQFPNTCLLYYNWMDTNDNSTGNKPSATGWWVLSSDAHCMVTCQYNFNDVIENYAEYVKDITLELAAVIKKWVLTPTQGRITTPWILDLNEVQIVDDTDTAPKLPFIKLQLHNPGSPIESKVPVPENIFNTNYSVLPGYSAIQGTTGVQFPTSQEIGIDQ